VRSESIECFFWRKIQKQYLPRTDQKDGVCPFLRIDAGIVTDNEVVVLYSGEYGFDTAHRPWRYAQLAVELHAKTV
jgi:hypothetical protein